MGDSVGFVVAVMTPGVILVVSGMVMFIAGGTRLSPRVWGWRLFYGGLGLAFVVPGIAGVIGVVTGHLMWPALFAALVALMMGSGIFYGLRLHWADPAPAGAPRSN